MDTTITKPDPIRNIISNGASKKSLCYLIIVAVLAVFVSVGSLYLLSQIPEIGETQKGEKPTEKSAGEIMRSLAPPEEDMEALEEVMKGLSAPSKKKTPEASEEILRNLTAPK